MSDSTYTVTYTLTMTVQASTEAEALEQVIWSNEFADGNGTWKVEEIN